MRKETELTAIHFKDEEKLQNLVGAEFSEWSEPVRIDQELIDQFAHLTGDTLWIHTDPARCADESPMGMTIAHGFLVLSLLPKMPSGTPVTERLTGYRHIMNYGSDKLRFLAPVAVNSDIHARSRIASIVVEDHKTKVALETQVKTVGTERLAVLYELIFVLM